MNFVIKVSTETGIDFISEDMSLPTEEDFKNMASELRKGIGGGNFSLTDKDGDIIIIPKPVIEKSIIQIIRTDGE